METLGGGGNTNEAATVITDKSLNEALDLLKQSIKKGRGEKWKYYL